MSCKCQKESESVKTGTAVWLVDAVPGCRLTHTVARCLVLRLEERYYSVKQFTNN